MANYTIVAANEALYSFVSTQIGTLMFSGDGNLEGGGRILNCKPITPPSVMASSGYVLASQIYALLTPQDEAEHAAVEAANLTIIDDFETAEQFLLKYVSA